MVSVGSRHATVPGDPATGFFHTLSLVGLAHGGAVVPMEQCVPW
jgi:hypothetical protein